MPQNKPISGLTTDNTPSRDDYFVTVDNASGDNKKVPASAALALTLDTDVQFSDVTTGDVSITKHGFAPKATGDATKFLNGVGGYSLPTTVLALTNYNPAVNTTVSTSSTTGVDVDPTNLTVTFTVPPSGKVQYIQKAGAFVTGSVAYWWSVRDTSGNNISGTRGRVSGASTHQSQVAISQETGLTPGATVTRRWGHGASGASGSIRYGDDGSSDPFGPAVMEVLALP